MFPPAQPLHLAGSNGRCAIVTNSSFMAPLQLVDFATERFYDILTINNMQFSPWAALRYCLHCLLLPHSLSSLHNKL